MAQLIGPVFKAAAPVVAGLLGITAANNVRTYGPAIAARAIGDTTGIAASQWFGFNPYAAAAAGKVGKFVGDYFIGPNVVQANHNATEILATATGIGVTYGAQKFFETLCAPQKTEVKKEELPEKEPGTPEGKA